MQHPHTNGSVFFPQDAGWKLSSRCCLCQASDGGDSDTLQCLLPVRSLSGRSCAGGTLLVLRGAGLGSERCSWKALLQRADLGAGVTPGHLARRAAWLEATRVPQAGDLAAACAGLHLAGHLTLVLSHHYKFPLVRHLLQNRLAREMAFNLRDTSRKPLFTLITSQEQFPLTPRTPVTRPSQSTGSGSCML